MAAAEPIRDKKQIKHLAEYYLKRGQVRNYALIVLGVHTALRISDLLRLRWEDVYDFDAQQFRAHVYVVEKKTGKSKQIALNKQAVSALQKLLNQQKTVWGNNLDAGASEFLFCSNRKNRKAISRVQAYRIIRAAANVLNLKGHITCHSLRKTFGYHAWKSGASAVLLMDIYNHTNYEVTRRYLGIAQDDRDKLYHGLSLT